MLDEISISTSAVPESVDGLSSTFDENSLSTMPAPESMNGPSTRRSLHKRRRDEPRSLYGLPFRGAQRKGPKRARIAYNDPDSLDRASSEPAPITFTPLVAELLAQMRRNDSGATGEQPTDTELFARLRCGHSGASRATGQRPRSNTVPLTNTVSENGQFLAQNAPCGHLSSSPQPLTLEPECLQKVLIEIEVKVRHSTPRERAPERGPTFSFAVIIMVLPNRSTDTIHINQEIPNRTPLTPATPDRRGAC